MLLPHLFVMQGARLMTKQDLTSPLISDSQVLLLLAILLWSGLTAVLGVLLMRLQCCCSVLLLCRDVFTVVLCCAVLGFRGRRGCCHGCNEALRSLGKGRDQERAEPLLEEHWVGIQDSKGSHLRDRILAGTCHSAKMMRTIILRRNYLHSIKKYQRYEKRHSNIPAHIPPCFCAKEGDHIIIGQCRPLSKTVRFNVLEVIPAGSSGGGKRAFTGM